MPIVITGSEGGAKRSDSAGVTQEASIAFEQGRYLEASERYLALTLLIPKDPILTYRLGVSYCYLGRYSEALKAFQQTLLLDPQMVEAYLNVGSIYCYFGQCNEAITYLEKAISLQPKLPLALNNLGVAYERTSRNKEAAQAFAQALRLEPGSSMIVINFLEFKTGRDNSGDEQPKKGRSRLWLGGDDNLNSYLIHSLATKPADQSEIVFSPLHVTTSSDAEKLDGLMNIHSSPQVSPIARQVTSLPNQGGNSSLDGKGVQSSNPLPADTNALPLDIAPNDYQVKRAAGLVIETKTIPQPADIYLVGIGDILDIRQMNLLTDRSTLYTVLSGGEIEYPPLSQPVVVAGLTTNEISVKLNSLLEKQNFADHPQTLTSIREYASHTVMITGLVSDPGEKIIQREAIPLYVIIAAALPKNNAGKVEVKCLKTGKTLVVLLSDEEAMKALVHAGDEVKVLERPAQYYYVGGLVRSGGQKGFHQGITLTQAILASGGSLYAGGKVAELIRENGDGNLTPKQYKLSDLMDGRVADPLLQAGDRIEVR